MLVITKIMSRNDSVRFYDETWIKIEMRSYSKITTYHHDIVIAMSEVRTKKQSHGSGQRSQMYGERRAELRSLGLLHPPASGSQ